jgi:MHS family proline/betaine transporter-like MFS transporter
MSTQRLVLAAVIGNALEWYDFILYALFSPTIAATFFPARTQVASLLLAVATFGAGFVLRPIGALVLGQYADRSGRRAALTLIIALMTLATSLIVFTPGWRRIGLLAPLLIVLSRLLQGFSVGGELGSSTALLIEAAPAEKRGLYASLQGASQSVAALAAASAAALVAATLAPAHLAAWGWRLPFLGGLLIGPVGFYLRANTHEPGTPKKEATPLLALWAHHRGAVLRTVGLVSLGTMSTYILNLNMPSYAHRELGIPVAATFASNAIGNVITIVVATLSGLLSDRIGARPIMLPSAIGLGVLVYPGFVLLAAHPSAAMLIGVQSVCLLFAATLSGAVYGLIGSLFPPDVRSSGLSVGYNVSVLLFGGFAPFITTWLIAATGDRHVPGLYVSAGALITTLALLVAWPLGRRRPADEGVA